jgi:peptidoglycan/xylan/chitin deacetylase (PgdA/CDA1 family)
MFRGKRELLARGLFWSGAAALIRRLAQRDSLLVLNYHRIGNPESDPFDPGVFSATADELNEQIAHLKRHLSLVTLEEAVAFANGAIHETARRCRVLITFDDGYLDNYETAFPILRSHGAHGVFFLATGIVGSCHVPWWDHIAYVLKTARQRRFTLHYPTGLAVDLEQNGLARSLQLVLNLYLRPENAAPGQFLQELKEAATGDDPPAALRRFLDWDEAREMLGGGMAIGSHTHSHEVLSRLTAEQQRQELVRSRAILKERLGIGAHALAYPVGLTSCFTDQTRQLAQEAGYRAAFSFYGGTNLPGATQRFDIRRIGVGGQSRLRFQVQSAVCGRTGKYWP